MDTQKFALVTDEKSFSTDEGWRVVTYNDAWNRQGWTALKGLSKDGAWQVATTLDAEGYIVCWDEQELQAAFKTERERVLANQMEAIK